VVLGFQDSATEWGVGGVGAAWPVPDSGIVVGELVALLAILTLAPVNTIAVVGTNVTVTVTDWPGIRIVPGETPLAVRLAPPVTVTPETLTFEFPLFISVDVSELLLPTDTVLKLRLDGLATSCAVAVEPDPVRSMTSCEGVPFVASVTNPLIVVVEVGVKIALNARLPPARIVVEVEIPVMLNPAPGGVTCENVRIELPALWSVMVCELLVPLTTVPKLTLAGVAEICAWVPDPDKGIVSGEFEALLVIVKLPVTELSDSGAN
jgi:hypothetical protein